MLAKTLVRLCCLFSMLVVFQSCGPKSLKERQAEYASKYEYGYLPPRPYDSYALLFCNLQIKDLERLLDLVEVRLGFKTLEEQIELQRGINWLLSDLILSIDLDAGTEKYGNPIMREPKRQAVKALFGFSMIQTYESLSVARQVVFDTEVMIHKELSND